MTNLFSQLLSTRCASCSRSGAQLCAVCLTTCRPTPRKVKRADFEGWTAYEYRDQITKLLHRLKTNGNLGLAVALAEPIACVLSPSTFNSDGVGAPQITLVPVPSRPAAFAKRGFVPARVVATAVLTQLSTRNSGVYRCAEVLWYGRGIKRQARLNRAERAGNLVGAMLARSPHPSESECQVWLVDDIVTTGATLLEARRALTDAGWNVAGFITLAETL